MRNLNNYPKLTNLQTSDIGLEMSLVYINGIAKGKAFDRNGILLLNSSEEQVLCDVDNFSTSLTRSVPNSQHDEFYIKVDSSDTEHFDYTGLAVIGDEVVWIKRDIDTAGSISGIATGETEIKFRVDRAINNTKGKEYPAGTIIRSIVNVTDTIMGFKYSSKSEASNSGLFSPVVSSGSLSMIDNIQRWSSYLDQSEFSIKKKLPIYIFQGTIGEVICDYIGFIIDFDLDPYNQQIDISFENKFSLYFEEEIKNNKVYKDATLKSVLSDVMSIPESMITYPTGTDGFPLYADNDFYVIDVLSLKEFTLYKDFIDSLCKEMCVRISFDSNEKLIIQSDVKRFNDEAVLKKYRYVRNTLGTQIDSEKNFISGAKAWIEISMYNKVGGLISYSDITTNTLPFDQFQDLDNVVNDDIHDEGYKSTETLADGYVTIDLGEAVEIAEIKMWHNYENNYIYKNNKLELSSDGVNWVSIFDSNVNGEYSETEIGKTISINLNADLSVVSVNETDDCFTINSKTSDKIIINKIDGSFTDRNTYYNRQDFLYSYESFDTIGEADINGEYDLVFTDTEYYKKEVVATSSITCELQWVNKGAYTTKEIVQPVKYSDKKKLSNVNILRRNAANEAEFDGAEIIVGTDIKYFKIGESYVMLTDGTKDFMGKVADVIVDAEDETQSKVVVLFGYDPDRLINYFGRVNYLDGLGYSDSKEFFIYYNRNEYVYVSEWKKGSTENTTSISFPVKPGETYDITGKFGGIDTPDGKFNGIVDDIESIYDIFTNTELPYSREYHTDYPLTIRANSFVPNQSILEYGGFDNSGMAVVISKSYDNEDSSFSFIKASEQTQYNSDDDYISKFVNTKFGYDIITKFDIGTIPEGTTLTTLDWTEGEIKDDSNKVWDNYKVSYLSDIYYITKSLCDVVRNTDVPTRTFGIGIEVANASAYNIGDMLSLSSDNLDDVNTKDNYNSYSDARWIVKSVDVTENVLILDFEYPEGLNNTQMKFDIWEAQYILVLQEFKIKGNPYIDVISTFFNEDAPSIAIYGEEPYSSITGKFIRQEDLEEATSYLLDGFGATNITNTKAIIMFETNMRYDLDVLDIVEISDSIFTGFDNQKAVIVSKDISSDNGETKLQYNAMSVGTYSIRDDLVVSSNFEYAPVTTPEYTHDKNAGGEKDDNIDLSNEQISKFDNNIGSVSLLRVNSNNLFAKIGSDLLIDATVIELSNLSSLLTDEQKKRYTDTILSVGKKLFIKTNEEFIYAKCLTILEDENGNILSANLEIKNRGAFKTTVSSLISAGMPIEFYQITQISGEDGLYSTGSTFGDIENREYFKFDTEDGVGLETSRGYLNIATEADWVDSLRDKFGLNPEMSDDEVLDYVGRGLLQIGDSRGASELEDVWDLLLDFDIPTGEFIDDYVVNKVLDYDTVDVSEIKFRFELDNDWTEVVIENEDYNLSKFLVPNETTALNETCLIKSIRNSKQNFNLNVNNVLGKFEIWSGSYVKTRTSGITQGSDSAYDVNNSPSTTTNGHGAYQIHNLDSEEVIFAMNQLRRIDTTEIGIGNNPNSNTAVDYTTVENSDQYTHRRLVVYIKRAVTTEDLGFMRYTRRGGLEVKGNITIDSGSIIINEYNANNFATLDDTKGLIGIGTNGTANIIAQTEAYLQVGDITSDNYFIYNNGTLALKTDDLTINNNTDNNYIRFTDTEGHLVINSNGASISKFQVGSTTGSVADSQNHIFYDTNVLQMRFNKGYIGNSDHNLYIEDSNSRLYLNNGKQQIGTNIIDSSTPDGNDGYSGFYFGDSNAEGIGQLSTGRYLKYDGLTFQMGDAVKIYKGEVPVTDFDKLIDHSMNELLKGTTTIADNVIKVYGDGKYTRAYTIPSEGSNAVQVHSSGNTNIINLVEFGHSGTFGNIDNLSDIERLGINKFIQLKNGSTIHTYKVDDIAQDSSYIVISALIPDDLIYDLYIEDDTSAIIKMGDLRESPDTGEFIRMGVGVDFANPDSKGIKFIDDAQSNYFIFDTVSGFKIQTDGIVDIRNGLSGVDYKNRLFFQEDDSYLYMNDGDIQLGKFQSLPLGLTSTSGEGFLVGNSSSHMFWTDNTFNIQGNVNITSGDTYDRLGGLDDDITDINTSIGEIAGQAYIDENDPRNGAEWAGKNKPDSEHVGEMWIIPSTGVIKTFILDVSFKWIEVNTLEGLEANDNSKQKARVFISNLLSPSSIPNGTTIVNTNDTWIVLNEQLVEGQTVYAPQTYIYSPSTAEKDGIEVKNSILSDWILAGSDNSNFINLTTGDSTLYFDSRVNTLDKIEIAKTGSRGFFSVGDIASSDYFYFTANDGQEPTMDISTTGKFFLRNIKSGAIENKIYFDSSKNEDVISMKKGGFQTGYVEAVKGSTTYRYQGTLITDHPSDLNTSSNLMLFNLDATPNTGLFGGANFYLKTTGDIDINGGNLNLGATSSMNLNATTLDIESNSALNIRSGSILNIESTSVINMKAGADLILSSAFIELTASSSMTIDGGSKFKLDSDNVEINTAGELFIHNNTNRLYFKKDGTTGIYENSKLQLNCTDNSINTFQIGEISASSYIAYDGSTLSIGGKLITENSAKNKRTILDGGVIQFSEKNSSGQYVETTAIRKMAFGVAQHGDIINLLNESNGITWNSPAVMASVSSISTANNENMRSLRVEARKLDNHRYEMNVTSSTLSVDDTIYWGTNLAYSTSSVNQSLSHSNLFSSTGQLINTVYIKYKVKSQLVGTATNAGTYVIKLYWKLSANSTWNSKTIASYSTTTARDTGYITITTVLDPNLEGLPTDMYVTTSGSSGQSNQPVYQQPDALHRIITNYEVNVGKKLGAIVAAEGGSATWFAFEQ